MFNITLLFLFINTRPMQQNKYTSDPVPNQSHYYFLTLLSSVPIITHNFIFLINARHLTLHDTCVYSFIIKNIIIQNITQFSVAEVHKISGVTAAASVFRVKE